MSGKEARMKVPYKRTDIHSSGNRMGELGVENQFTLVANPLKYPGD